MDRRAAKHRAHSWVAQVIEGALGNGDGDTFGVETDEDFRRVLDAIREIQQAHDRRGDRWQ